MILLCGIPTEPPIALVAEQLSKLGSNFVMLNQRYFESTELVFEISNKQVTGQLRIGNRKYRLEAFQGVYTRVMDAQSLPELEGVTHDSPQYKHCMALHNALVRWYEIAPCRVVNRALPMGSNFSKPYQSQLIRSHGFNVPETLVTNNPEAVLDFRQRHGKIIYKSISGVRSIVQQFQDRDVDRLCDIRWCPVQFQQFVEGTNIRVHVVGNEIFATSISSDATDYRYAQQQVGEVAQLRPLVLPDELSAKCLVLAEALELPFAGIDLKITSEGQIYCFEVNPSPAFSYYEENTQQPISYSLARYLSGIAA